MSAEARRCERCSGPHDHVTEECCSTHRKRLCHACYRRTHFVEVCDCALCTPPRECKPGCTLNPDDDANHEAFGGCLDDEAIAELKLMARDYEAWSRL